MIPSFRQMPLPWRVLLLMGKRLLTGWTPGPSFTGDGGLPGLPSLACSLLKYPKVTLKLTLGFCLQRALLFSSMVINLGTNDCYPLFTGRTIKEFIFHVMTVPVVYTFLWMAIFGGAGLKMQRTAENLGINCTDRLGGTNSTDSLNGIYKLSCR